MNEKGEGISLNIEDMIKGYHGLWHGKRRIL
jgi:hypothetical protein